MGLKELWNRNLRSREIRTILGTTRGLETLEETGLFLRHKKLGNLLVGKFWKDLDHASDLIDTNWLEKVHPDEREIVAGEWEYADRGGTDSSCLEYRIRDVNGDYHWVRSKIWVLSRDRHQRILCYLGQDIALNSNRVPEDISNIVEELDVATQLVDEFAHVSSWEGLWLQLAQTAWRLFPSAYSWILRFDLGSDVVLGPLQTPEITTKRRPFGFQKLSSQDSKDIRSFLQSVAGTFRIEGSTAPPWLLRLTEGTPLDTWIFSRLGDPDRPQGWLVYRSSSSYYLETSDLSRVKVLSEGFLHWVSRVGDLPKTLDLPEAPPSPLDFDQAIQHLRGYLEHNIPEKRQWGYLVGGKIEGPSILESHPGYPRVLRARSIALERLEDWVSYKGGLMLHLPYPQWILGFQGIRPSDFLGALEDLNQLIITQTRDLGFPLGIKFRVWDSSGNLEYIRKELVRCLADELS